MAISLSKYFNASKSITAFCLIIVIQTVRIRIFSPILLIPAEDEASFRCYKYF